MNKEYGRFYSEIFEKRQTGDYKDLVEFNKKDVEKWIGKMKDFISEIEKFLLNQMNDSQSQEKRSD